MTMRQFFLGIYQTFVYYCGRNETYWNTWSSKCCVLVCFMNQKMFSGSIHDSNGFLMWLIWFKVEAARNGCNLAALRFHAIFPLPLYLCFWILTNLIERRIWKFGLSPVQQCLDACVALVCALSHFLFLVGWTAICCIMYLSDEWKTCSSSDP